MWLMHDCAHVGTWQLCKFIQAVRLIFKSKCYLEVNNADDFVLKTVFSDFPILNYKYPMIFTQAEFRGLPLVSTPIICCCCYVFYHLQYIALIHCRKCNVGLGFIKVNSSIRPAHARVVLLFKMCLGESLWQIILTTGVVIIRRVMK